jgi:hypothetical protein
MMAQIKSKCCYCLQANRLMIAVILPCSEIASAHEMQV